ncbi:molecular chaperone [Pseudomonas sp. PS1]|uniref:Molecular chaperone n=1 Tax=Stutzerimonas marianensis TaxID=2929513 RepID=A0A9X1W5W6_9GAMM|nr:molecular chaperone [Pseudomonas marianensis]
MENHSQPLLLRVPKPDRHELSFCEPTVRDLKRWLGGLPKANLGETARLLYQAMLELNQLRASTQGRLQLLEVLRPEIHYVCRQLERYYLNQPIVLSERPRKVASLCQALQNHLAIGYKLISVDLVSQAGRDRLQMLTIALQRAIHTLSAILVRSTQLYNPTPDGLWLELHQLHAMAVEEGVHRTVVRDELAYQTEGLSAEQSYIVALMIGSARCNQMRQQNIARLAEVMEPWSRLIRLQPVQQASTLFAVSTRTDAPPRYRTMFSTDELPYLLGIDPHLLVESLRKHLQAEPGTRPPPGLVVPEGLSMDLMQHVSAAWGDVSERSFQRTPAQGHVELCIGMTALHYFLAGGRLFADLLKHPEAARSAVFKLNNATPDVWSTAFDAQSRSDMELLPTEHIEFVSATETRSDAEEKPAECPYPTYRVQLINHSPGGFCLSWSGEVPAQLQAGELLGLQDGTSQNWSVAVVRWIRQVRGSGPQMGVELIAPYAQPCGVRLLRKVEQGSEYLRALLLPEIRVISRAATLIVPRLPFQEGQKVQVNQNGEEHRAMLCHRQASSNSYNQFEYQLVGAGTGSQETPITGRGSEPPAGAEDFDSLWKSL